MEKNMTLREAFTKFHQKNYKIIPDKGKPDESELFYNCHDIVHVVFGCDTTLKGEGIVKLWTLFGTNLGIINHIKEYGEANAFTMFKQYSLKHVLMNIFKLIALAPRVIFRAKKMKKKWPWATYEQYLDKPVYEIRKEFNILPI